MLMPKKVKFRRVQRGRMKGRSKGARDLRFGDYGLQAVEPCWLTSQQIEAMRVAVSRHLLKGGNMFLRVFPDKPVTKKPAETRMGKGKGTPELWVFVVKRGRVIVELAGLSEQVAKSVLKLASYKLPMRTRIIRKGTNGQSKESTQTA
jgi:large subunit ribosomal protein L16